MVAALFLLKPILHVVFPPSCSSCDLLSRLPFHLIHEAEAMAPFPNIPALEWPKSIIRSLGTPTINIPELVRRQQTTVTVVPATVTVIQNNNGGGGGGGSHLSGGAIAGIVIGSVVGVLLLIWIVRSCFNLGAPPQEREKWYRDAPPAHHHRSTSRSHHRSRSRRPSVVEVPQAVYVQQSRSRSRSQRRPAGQVIYDSNNERGRSGRRRQSGGSYYV